MRLGIWEKLKVYLTTGEARYGFLSVDVYNKVQPICKF